MKNHINSIVDRHFCGKRKRIHSKFDRYVIEGLSHWWVFFNHQINFKLFTYHSTKYFIHCSIFVGFKLMLAQTLLIFSHFPKINLQNKWKETTKSHNDFPAPELIDGNKWNERHYYVSIIFVLQLVSPFWFQHVIKSVR